MTETLSGDESLIFREFDAPPSNPLLLASEWFAGAQARGVREPWVASLATVGSDVEDGYPLPSTRMVLIKELDAEGFVFTTYGSSRKGRDLALNPRASLVFYWRETMQQLRVDGVVRRLEDHESDELFAERPRVAQATTAVSHQGRDLVDEGMLAAEACRLVDGVEVIPRPADWAGYRLTPTAIEFWQGRTDRLHRRLAYRLTDGTGWRAVRLQP